MKTTRACQTAILSALLVTPLALHAKGEVADAAIAAQRAALQQNTAGQGFGPQSPRDIDSPAGSNTRVFSTAPRASALNLCNIHFHRSAEHRGGEFTTYAGNGDGNGYGSGYQYDGELDADERAPVSAPVCAGDHGALSPGDTIEVHYVHSSAQVTPGPTLGACLDDAIKNPQLRVETLVLVLVNDDNAADFTRLAAVGQKDGYHQALNLPEGEDAVEYAGSTTGPGYNETGSPFQVTWRVRPDVVKADIRSVGKWCQDNVFEESGAHGVRNLVRNPALLAPIP
jgi:hypothetical protein